MSLAVMGLVWGTTLEDSEMLVALALADRGDDYGVCWPSIEWLVWKTNKSERTVRNAITGLVERGVLKRETVAGQGVFYYLQLDVLRGLARPKPAKRARLEPRQRLPGSAQAGTPATAAGVAEGTPARKGRGTPATVAPNTLLKPTTSGSDEPEARARDLVSEFETWFAAYPHRVGKPAARAAWFERAGAGTLPPLERLLAEAETYRRTKPADRQWCNPARWLGEERWNDQPADRPAVAAPRAEPLPSWPGPQAVRAAVAELIGEDKARSYLDPAQWRGGRIVPRNRIAFDALAEALAGSPHAGLLAAPEKPPPRAAASP